MTTGKKNVDGLDQIQLQRGNDLRALKIVFAIFGGYGIIAAFPILVVGCFVGPVILLVGILHVALGAVALMIRWGLGARSRIAWWLALGFVLLLVIVAASALAGIFGDATSAWEDKMGATVVPLAAIFLLSWTLFALIRPQTRAFFVCPSSKMGGTKGAAEKGTGKDCHDGIGR